MLPRALLPVLVVLLAAGSAGVASAQQPDRYALAGGCWNVGGDVSYEQVRFQATALGRYLLYLEDGTFLAVDGAGGVAPAPAPSPAADFAVSEANGGFDLAPQSTGERIATITVTPAEGCAEYPEAPLNAEGAPSRGPSSFGTVTGIVEGHMHWMAYQYFGGHFRCGKPWDAYGIPYAMPDCADNEGPQGTTATLQNTLNYGNPAQAHSTENWPGFPNQSKDNLNYEGMYWRWVERVYKAGLRLMVMGVNENRVLCELQTKRSRSCNEMDTMRSGFAALKELEDYVDAQAGGPGKGFFEIVTDPYRAREVINEGRMAVVMEIETSEPFDCIGWEQVTCDREQIKTQIQEMHDVGVRSSLLLNKFDNPLTGVRFDSGAASVLINAGNKQSAGSYWDAETCKGPLHDNQIDMFPTDGTSDQTVDNLGIQGGTFPTYPPPPHCNRRGLTELGRYAIKQMIKHGWIVNPDHMSQRAVDDTLTLLESRNYSGVISPHGWMDPGNWPRLWKLGGMAFPGHSGTDNYVEEWQTFRPRRTPYAFGWGYGADLGGLSHQPDKSKEGSITYPFTSYDGKVSFDRQTTGERTFDFSQEGVAHYGLYADWFADLERVGGEQIAKDMMAGAESYLQMWERASGVARGRCFSAREPLRPEGRGPIRLGDDWRELLDRAGQPQQRTRTWSWCVGGKDNRRRADVAVLSAAGDVQLVGSTAHERRGAGARVDAPADGPDRLRVRKRDGAAFVHAIRDGRVAAVAVTTPAFAAKRGALRKAVARVLAAKATNAPRRFVPAEKQADGRMLGRTLAGSPDRQTNARLALLCNLALNL